jgi:hypothetical protein
VSGNIGACASVGVTCAAVLNVVAVCCVGVFRCPEVELETCVSGRSNGACIAGEANACNCYATAVRCCGLGPTGIDEEVYARFEEDFALYEKYKTEFLETETVTPDEEGLKQSDFFVLTFYNYETNEAGEITEYTGADLEAVKKQAEDAFWNQQ